MAERITPQQVLAEREAGRDPLLVCAYDDEEKCRGMRLEGALTLGELRERQPQLERDRLIAFYCT